jgi:hypothetical protein
MPAQGEKQAEAEGAIGVDVCPALIGATKSRHEQSKNGAISADIVQASTLENMKSKSAMRPT